MRNVLIVIVVIVLAVDIFGFLFSDDDRSANRSRASERTNEQTIERVEASGEVSLELGETIYSNTCAVCHGHEGQGGVGEKLADNQDLADASYVVKRIMQGQAPMPALVNSLSDEEIASVASYIRNSWGNEFGEVSARGVAAER
jgi:mono/diheme cytochrome c family protein